jgi:4-amino-4-deoxy-L-arabinose transferase-like glycosyltransferase
VANLVRRGREPLLVVLAVAAFALIGARWIRDFRLGLPMHIDEAGYTTFSLLHHRALESGGLDAWVDSVMGSSVFAPLLPGTTSLAYALAGVHRGLGLFVALAYGCIALLASHGLGRAVAGRAGGWLSLAVAAATPVLIAYSRSFNFAVAAAAAAAVLLWALARSDRWLSPGWSALAGLGLGAMVLARTMTVAFVPALVVAAVVAVAVGPRRLRRAGNVLLSGLVALAVAGPWYYRNGEAVYDYLTSFAYGDRSTEFGGEESLLSPRSWRHMLEHVLLGNVGLPLTLVAGACVGLLVVVSARTPGTDRPRVLRWLSSPLLPSFLFAGWAIVILTTTGNKDSGTGFLAPLVPACAALVAAAVVRRSGWIRTALAAAVVGTLLLNTAASIGTANPLADGQEIGLGPLGRATLVDGTGAVPRYIYRGMLTPPPHRSQPLAREVQLAWVAASRRIATALDPNELTVFGFRHRLLNVNTVQLEQVLAGRQQLPVTMVSPIDTPDAPSMTAWLEPLPACELLLSDGESFELLPVTDQDALHQAAQAAGYAPTDQSWRLPDGRVVTRWHRATCAT